MAARLWRSFVLPLWQDVVVMIFRLDLEDDMTWGDIKRWVDAVESQGSVDPSMKVMAEHEQYPEIKYLEVAFETGKKPNRN